MKPDSWSWLIGFGLILPAVGGVSAAQVDSPAYYAPGTRRMAERLEQIAKNTNPAVFPWVNRERAEYFHRESANPENQTRALQLRMQYAHELLWSGQAKRAIHEFTLFRRVFERPQINVPPVLLKQVRDALATSYLRLGDEENSLARHSVDSCLMPIRGSGVHTIQTG